MRHLIQNFNHREPGYSLLLHALLDFVEYKEYDVMTNYFLNNLEDVSNKFAVMLLNTLWKYVVAFLHRRLQSLIWKLQKDIAEQSCIFGK